MGNNLGMSNNMGRDGKDMGAIGVGIIWGWVIIWGG